jgi:SAM-dependent methyltransferase
MTERRSFRCVGCGADNPMALEFRCDGYQVYRCPACRTVITRPLPGADVLAAHYASYNEEYTAGMGAERYGAEMPKRWLARLALMRRFGAGGRLLDLAGSNGMFGRLASERGFRVSVADFIREPKDLGFCTAVPCDLDRVGGVPFDDGSFDAVTLWSCIEHVTAPENALRELFRLCRPGGIVAVDTPLIGDSCERAFAARSHWIAPPEHLHVFSALGLRLSIERAGLDVVFHSPFHERTRARWLARRGRNVAVAAAGALLRSLAPDRWSAARGGRITQAGDIQVLVARKPAA